MVDVSRAENSKANFSDAPQMVSRQDIGTASRRQTQAHGRRAFPGARVGSAPRRLRAVRVLQPEGLPVPRHLPERQTVHRQQGVLLQPHRHDRGASGGSV